MTNRTSNDASRSSSIETMRFQGKNPTDTKKQISGGESLYIAKNCLALKFEKIKKSFSTLIHGKEFSKQAHSTKITHIKNKINTAKIGLDKREKNQSSTTNIHDRANEDRSQIRKPNQDRQYLPNNRDNPTSNRGSHRGTPAALPQTIIIQHTGTTQQETVVHQPMVVQTTPNMQQIHHMPQSMFMQQTPHMQQPQYVQQTPTMQQPMVMPQTPYVQQPTPNSFQGMMAIPVVPAYVMSSTLPPPSYFQNNWYTPMSASAAPAQSSMATTRSDPSASRRLPNARSMETSARPARQNYRLGTAPDRTAFYQELSKDVTKQLRPLSQMSVAQKLHVLSHMMYSGDIPNYSNEKMKVASFDLINKIEQLRLDYVPNANDGSSNIYKVIFNNLLRDEIVATLPEELGKKFLLADEEYQTTGDFNKLIKTYQELIGTEIDSKSENSRTETKKLRPGDITSEWMAKMNQSLSPFREQIENWNDLDKYQALQYLLRGDKADLSTNKKVEDWADDIDDIRASNIHDADDYDRRNEQKVFYNNNLRSVLKNSLPESFQEQFDVINIKFQSMDPSSQATGYEKYLEDLRAIVSSEMKKLRVA